MTVMLRPSGKAQKIANKVMKSKGVKVKKPKSETGVKLSGPYLLH